MGVRRGGEMDQQNVIMHTAYCYCTIKHKNLMLALTIFYIQEYRTVSIFSHGKVSTRKRYSYDKIFRVSIVEAFS